MVNTRVTIRNSAGIHVRPSGVIFTAIRGYDGDVIVRHSESEIQLTSVMGLIALGLTEGDAIEIEVSGPDESAKLDELFELFSREYDFPRNG